MIKNRTYIYRSLKNFIDKAYHLKVHNAPIMNFYPKAGCGDCGRIIDTKKFDWIAYSVEVYPEWRINSTGKPIPSVICPNCGGIDVIPGVDDKNLIAYLNFLEFGGQ